MRQSIAVAAALPFALSASFAQSRDLPPEISFAGGSVAPSQLWPGNIAQLYEANAPSGPVSATENTAAQALTNAQVWGHDEGPSTILADGRVLWYWGDSVTGYQETGVACVPSGAKYCAYQLSMCTSNSVTESCLGGDTVSFVPAAGVPAKLYGCVFMSAWDNALLAGQTFTPDYSHCSQMQYIAPHAGGNGAPKAAFTFESAYLDSSHPLVSGEDLLLGHTATGIFALPDSSDSALERLYVLYQVQSVNNAGFNFRTESILMRGSNYTSDISISTMPILGRYYPLSSVSIPSGTLAVVNGAGTATLSPCTGSHFSSSWTTATVWQGMLIEDPSGGTATYPIQSASSSSVTITGNVPNSPPSTCTPSAVQFDAVPTQQGNTGKFMYTAAEILTSAQVAALGPGVMPWLPANDSAVCFWGASFYYRQSNLSLACAVGTDAALTASGNTYYAGYGASVLYYFTGFSPSGLPQWETVSAGTNPAEVHAVPLLYSWNHAGSSDGAPCIGEHSVRWISPLHRFLLTYGSAECGGLYYRTATAPWGPWSAETRFFPNNPGYGWTQRIVYAPGAVGTPDFNVASSVPLYRTNGLVLNQPGTQEAPFAGHGNPYGPYLYPGSTALANSDGTVTVLMNLSGFNPYVTWQLAAKFYQPTGVSLSGTVKITPSVKIVP